VERADRIARELEASAKGTLHWVGLGVGGGMGVKKNRGAVDIFGKK